MPKPLAYAIVTHDHQQVKYLLGRGSSANCELKYWGISWTPLTLAVRHGTPDMIQLLIAAKASIKYSAIFGAIANRNASDKKNIMRALIESGASVHAQDGLGRTALDLLEFFPCPDNIIQRELQCAKKFATCVSHSICDSK